MKPTERFTFQKDGDAVHVLFDGQRVDVRLVGDCPAAQYETPWGWFILFSQEDSETLTVVLLDQDGSVIETGGLNLFTVDGWFANPKITGENTVDFSFYDDHWRLTVHNRRRFIKSKSKYTGVDWFPWGARRYLELIELASRTPVRPNSAVENDARQEQPRAPHRGR